MAATQIKSWSGSDPSGPELCTSEDANVSRWSIKRRSSPRLGWVIVGPHTLDSSFYSPLPRSLFCSLFPVGVVIQYSHRRGPRSLATLRGQSLSGEEHAP